MTNATRRGRPMKRWSVTAQEAFDAVKVTIVYNPDTDKYDYDVANGYKRGSCKRSGYIRECIMNGQLKFLSFISDNFTRKFRLDITEKDGTKFLMYAYKNQ